MGHEVLWDDASGSPCDSDATRQELEESQEASFSDDFDQRPPRKWVDSQWDQTSEEASAPRAPSGPEIEKSIAEDERQWDQTPPCRADTPLGQWAFEANCWDGIDPIPQEDEPVFYTD